MLRRALWIIWVTMASVSLVGATEVSILEAIHVAEMFTESVATEWSVKPLDGVDHIVVTLPDGAAKRSVWVNGDHGRVSRVERLSSGQRKTTYQWPGIKVVAHRGGAHLGPPENTAAAIEKAIEVGADMIEIDIRETKDGHLVIMHDSTVDRTTNGTGRVIDLTLEEIRSLDAGSWKGETYRGLKVPTLKEALELMRGRIDPDLDFKAGDVQKLIAVVNEVGIADRCTHHSSWERCGMLKELEPRIRIRPTIQYARQVPELATRLRPPIINMDWHAITEESIRLAHLSGCEAFINCLNRADTLPYARYCAENGADYIQSDRPDLVSEMLQKMGLRYDPTLNQK